MKRRKPIKRVSDKRKVQNAEYLKIRKEFLAEHPYCEVWLQEHGYRMIDAIEGDGYAEVAVPVQSGCLTERRMVKVPLATDIHHRLGRIGDKLCDVSGFMAVSRTAHKMIHGAPAWARANGYLA